MARILVVEDNPANMTLAVFLLHSAGHTVLSATDAEAGLTLAREAPTRVQAQTITRSGAQSEPVTVPVR